MTTEFVRAEISGVVKIMSNMHLADKEVVEALWEILSGYATQDYWGKFAIYWASAAFMKESIRSVQEERQYTVDQNVKSLIITTYERPRSNALKIKASMSSGMPKVTRCDTRRINTAERVNISGYRAYAVIDLNVGILLSSEPMFDEKSVICGHYFDSIKKKVENEMSKNASK